MNRPRRKRLQHPELIRLWNRIPVEFRRRVHSYSWSASSHFLGIVVLFICTFPIELKEPLVIELGLSSGMDDEPLTLDSMEEPMTPLESIEETVENIVSVELPLVAEMPKLLPSADEGVKPTESLNTLVGGASTQLTEVDSSDSRVVEVNRRVKAAGGGLSGSIRVSLMWESNDDIDLHMSYQSTLRPSPRMPIVESGYLWFGQPATVHARLDVDANAHFIVRNPCENIVFKTVPKKSKYLIAVNLYSWRSGQAQVPYTVVVHNGKKSKIFEGTISRLDGLKQIHSFSYP